MRLILLAIIFCFSYSSDEREKREHIFENYIQKLDDKETNESLQQLVKKDFGIVTYKSTYILPATYSFNNFDDDRKKVETSFQISAQKPIFYNVFTDNDSINIAYTQKSFWQTASSSAPFRETNYEPEIFANFYINNKHLKLLKVSLNHFSNGKAEDESRSANRVYLQSIFQFDNFFISPKVWYRVPEKSSSDDNPDYSKYYGYGELNMMYLYKKHSFELLLRNNLRLNDQNKGAVEFNWKFPLPEFMKSKNSFGMVQIFSGYGQSFIDYDKDITNIGFGIAFSR